MPRPTISIAMATFNGAAYLDEQLASFLSQSVLPDEMVVTDDGSKDGTLAIVEEFAEHAPFEVRVERNAERLGYTPNFSKAVSLCSCDVIFLSDQDDIWLERKIERSLKELARGFQLVLNDQTILTGHSPASSTVLGNARMLGFPDRTFIAGSCTAMTKEFASLALPFPESIPYDNWVGLLAHFLAVRNIIQEPLQLYRRHDRNATDPIFALARPSLLDIIGRHGLADPRAAWQRQIATLECYRDRIEQRRAMLEHMVGVGGVEEALSRIEREQTVYATRLKALALPRLRRPKAILGAWQNGVYADFSGWKSVLKDLIRP